MTRTSLLPLAALALLLGSGCESAQDAGPATPSTAPLFSAAVRSDGGPPGSVVFYSRRAGSLAKIYAMNPDGTGVRPLTSGPGNDLWPDLSPNGRLLTFASNRSGNNEIYVLDLRSGELTNVSQSPASLNTPASSA